MREFFVKAKNLSIVTIIASLVLGIVLLAKPDQALYAASMICGITLILLGVFAALSYFIKDKNTLLLILGVFAIIAGIIVCVKYRSIVSILVFLFGLFILIGGVVDFVSAIDTKRNGMGSWIVSLVLSIVSIVFGLLAVLNPFESSLTVVKILGAGLIIYAVMDIIVFVQVKRIAKAVKNAVEDGGEIEADAREVDD